MTIAPSTTETTPVASAKSAPAQPARRAYVITRPTVPEQFYVSAGTWALNALTAFQFQTVDAAKKVARKLNLSGLSIKIAPTADTIAAQQALIAASNAAAAKVVTDRRAAKIARREKRAKGGTSKGDPSAQGMQAPHRGMQPT